jgi:hypothetical protein
MKRIILLCIAFLFISEPSSAQKVLYITANSATPAATEFVNATVYRIAKTLGYEYDQILASDTIAVEAAFESGEYGICVPINLFDFGSASFITHTQIMNAGWGELDQWIDPTSPKHAEIPILVLASGDIYKGGAWALAKTGIVYSVNSSTGKSESISILSSAGDSIYIDIHWGSSYGIETRVTDSVNWCEPIVWVTPGPSSNNQKYALIWRTLSMCLFIGLKMQLQLGL